MPPAVQRQAPSAVELWQWQLSLSLSIWLFIVSVIVSVVLLLFTSNLLYSSVAAKAKIALRGIYLSVFLSAVLYFLLWRTAKGSFLRKKALTLLLLHIIRCVQLIVKRIFSSNMFKQNHWKFWGVVLATDILCEYPCALTGFFCKERSWVSVALMEMSMEITTWSLMCAQQNKGRYSG